MSEVNLNDVVEEVVHDSEVITVPIDDTLSVSGEAADAKAVGDALDLKADKSELSTAVNVNGQSADAQGNILVYGNHIPMSNAQGAQSVKAAVEAIQAWDADDIPVDSSAQTPVSVQEMLEDLDERSGADIDLSEDPDDGTIGEAIAALDAEFTDAEIHEMLVDAGYEEDDEE